MRTRTLLFLLNATTIALIADWMGQPPELLPWLAVGGGIGGVFAVEYAMWLVRHGSAARKGENDPGPQS